MEPRPANLIVQGDVFITPCKIPETAKKLDHGVLAEGEATGHSHSLTDLGTALLMLEGGNIFLRVKEGHEAEIKHQEHKSIFVPAGEYNVGKVREYDPFEEEARLVVD
jgi:hypothetical protein